MIVSYDFYKSVYDDEITEPAFNRLCFLAEKHVKNICTGMDGISKLDRAFPDDDGDAMAVKMSICAVLNLLNRIDNANSSVESGQAVKSKSAGNESITYATDGIISTVSSDKAAQLRLIAETAEEYLRGSRDANGVNLLYRGYYPRFY